MAKHEVISKLYKIQAQAGQILSKQENFASQPHGHKEANVAHTKYKVQCD